MAGVLVMSGYLAGAKQFKLTSGLEHTPILHCHGTRDPMVQLRMAQQTQQALTDSGVTDYTLKTYPMEHTVIHEEIADATRFFSKSLPHTASCDSEPKKPAEMSVKELKAAIKAAGLGQQAVGLMEKGDLVDLLQNKH